MIVDIVVLVFFVFVFTLSCLEISFSFSSCFSCSAARGRCPRANRQRQLRRRVQGFISRHGGRVEEAVVASEGRFLARSVGVEAIATSEHSVVFWFVAQ